MMILNILRWHNKKILTGFRRAKWGTEELRV